MKFVSTFEPLSFWAQGPWVFFNMGLKFMQTWQDECFSRLSLVVPAAGKPLSRNGVKAESTLCEIQLLNKEIAARQGRQMPLLGCLQNVAVVGGPTAEESAITAPAKQRAVKAPAAVVAAPAVEESPVNAPDSAGSGNSVTSVTSMLAMQAKSLAKAVKTSPAPVVDKKSTAKKATKPVAKSPAQAPVKVPVKAAVSTVGKAVAKAKPVSAKPVARAASKKA